MRHDELQAEAPPLATTIRDAKPSDIPRLLALDDRCFPPGDETREPAAPGEIEKGVRAGRVRVLEVGAELVGFLQHEVPATHHLYVSALGVDPDFRGRGFAGRLLDDLLARVGAADPAGRPSISTVTSPRNLEMLGLLLSRNFVVRTIVADYFGPGKDRFYCQHKTRVEYVDPDDRYFIPVTASAQASALLSAEDYMITGLVTLPAGPAFEISRVERDDFAGLQSDESATGVAFSGGILASITFVLGLSFAYPSFPDGVRVLLMGAALATTAGLIVYANTSGELARLRTNRFGRYMKWGNVLSEFGGVFPFLISLPVTFAKVTTSVWAALVAAVVFGVALLAYDRSSFSMSARFRQSFATRGLSVLVAVAPILGVLAVHFSPRAVPWVWAAAVTLALAAQSVTYLLRRPDESVRVVSARRWQSRR